jgi:hypothetical protein
MTETFHCDDKTQLVSYLYDELDGMARRRIDEHLRVCPSCADEVTALAGVRQELCEWTPPEVTLGFSLVPPAAAARPAGRVLRPVQGWMLPDVPAWAQAIAAVLVLAAGLAIANVQVRYGGDGLVITTGWMARSAVPGVTPQTTPMAAASPTADADWRPALAELESTLRQEIRAARPAAANASNSPPADLPMQRVAQLIEESEKRQQQQLALRLTQFNRDLEVQRRSDLVRINQGFGQFEGRAGAEIARQRQMLDYMMRVSAQPPPQ